MLASGCIGSGAGVRQSTRHFPQQTGFVQRELTIDGVRKSYWVFLPPNYHPSRLHPTVLFLHGLFEGGNGGSNVLSAGLGPVIARNPEAWPFITIFPQSNGSWQGDEHERLAIAALDDAEKQYPIDPDRVILAGLSYGGLGVWEIGARNKGRFAALVPVSGHAAPELAEALVLTPVWAFASRDDMWVNADNSRQMCAAIQSRGGRARLTEFPGGEHDCWALAIDGSELMTWMLRQKRNPLQAVVQTSDGTVRLQTSGRLRSIADP